MKIRPFDLLLTQRLVKWIGLLTYSVLAALSVLFYKERVAFVDIAYHLFTILRTDSLAIQNFRFGAAVTQLVPLFAGRLGFDIQTVAILYSLAFVLWHAFVFAVCVWVFRLAKWGMVMLLFSTLMVTHTFYWIQSELPQGIAFMILFFAIYQRWLENKIKLWSVLFLAPGLFVLVFFHPTLFIPFSFVCLFFILTASHRIEYLALLMTMLLMTYIKNNIFSTSYDGEKIKQIENLVTIFPAYHNTLTFKNFVKWFFTDYYLLALGWMSVFSCYLWQKRWMLALLVIVSFSGYVILITASYPEESTQFYLENLLLPLSIFVVIPVVFSIAEVLPFRWVVWGLSTILAIRVIHIASAHTVYSTRLAWQHRLLNQTARLPQPKLLIPAQGIPLDTILMAWGSPYEFWLLSSIETPNQVRSIIITNEPNAYEWALPERKRFLTQWGAFPYSELNIRPGYFRFTDTISSYKKVSYAEVMRM